MQFDSDYSGGDGTSPFFVQVSEVTGDAYESRMLLMTMGMWIAQITLWNYAVVEVVM